MRKLCIAWIILTLSFMAGAQAEVRPIPSPGDPRLVVFPFDANSSYRILTRPRSVTHIELSPGERVRILALGDTVSWQAADRDNHVFIKPTYPNQSVSGTLVTNLRTYQLFLQAGSETDKWYQRVTFQYPDLIARERIEADRAKLAPEDAIPGVREDLAERRNALAVSDPADLNFTYEITGTAAFRPLQIYDDGKSTYIRLDTNLVDMPALFRLRDGKDLELVDYANRNNLLIVGRVLEAGTLKLGDAEVRFHNTRMMRKRWFGSGLESIGNPPN
jgi:type IV secretion system protein VirB9